LDWCALFFTAARKVRFLSEKVLCFTRIAFLSFLHSFLCLLIRNIPIFQAILNFARCFRAVEIQNFVTSPSTHSLTSFSRIIFVLSLL
jgi:hypothetical protein